MIQFVNAKLNLGLNIVSKRQDGYHNLETIFYPIGLYNGSAENQDAFCDILEICPDVKTEFVFTGRRVDCPLEKNLVYKAWKLFKEKYPSLGEYRIALEKHLPDGAGLGGGSADAAFVLKMLNVLEGSPFDDDVLSEIALTLGADCPFFIFNKPCFAEGVGEKLTSITLDLTGKWALLVKPSESISTKEAFAGVLPGRPLFDIKDIYMLDVSEWKGKMINDFEMSLFPGHPVLSDIKSSLIEHGSLYAAMSGSGSTLFGIFQTLEQAQNARKTFSDYYTAVCKL